jgi:hypothetical protein
MALPHDPNKREHLRLAVLAEQARRDIDAFCEFVMRDQEGRPWRQQPFHRQWQASIPMEGPLKLLIGAPRESAKTSQMVARILWELGRNPELRIKVVSATQELAGNIVAEVQRHIIDHNPRLRLVFPGLRPNPSGPWSRGELLVQRRSLAKDPSVVAAGILSSGVGGRADLIVFDDVCDQRNAILQPAMRQQIKATFHETWENLLGPGGRAVYIATVWHVDDLTMELRNSGAWQVWWRPAQDPVNGELLWPERWTAEALARREREIGARAFARQFLLQPVSDEERTFPDMALDECLDNQVIRGQLLVPEEWPRVAGVDLAASLGQRTSWTVMVTAAIDPESGCRHMLEVVRARQSFPATIKMIENQFEKHKHRLIFVESNGYQQVVLGQLSSEDMSIPVRGFQTSVQKYDESVGIPSLSASMANGSWRIPTGGEPHPSGCECGWCALVRELQLHPYSKYTDCLMAPWFCESAARELGRYEALSTPMILLGDTIGGIPREEHIYYRYQLALAQQTWRDRW